MTLGHLDKLQEAEIVSKSKLVSSVLIKNKLLNKSQVINFIIAVVVTDRFHCSKNKIAQIIAKLYIFHW